MADVDPFEPVRVALGPDGNIYALISGNDSTVNHIFVFSPDGRQLRAIDGRASEIAFDASGNLYAGDFFKRIYPEDGHKWQHHRGLELPG